MGAGSEAEPRSPLRIAPHAHIERVESSTLPTIAAAIAVLLCPDVYDTHKTAWEAYGASERGSTSALPLCRANRA